MPTIYVLLCAGNRYYIGKTDRPIQDRVEEHFSHNGSEWTRKYKPIKVIEIIQNADDFDEDKYTKQYMKEHGIDRVRGGTYTQIQLPEFSIKSLEKELCNASDLCFRCNRPGHFANQCYATNKSRHQPISDTFDVWCCEYCNKEFRTYYAAEKHEQICTGTEVKSYGYNGRNPNTCYRCGRTGHYANECFASTHAKGYWLQKK